MASWKEIATKIKERIESGDFPAGVHLPKEAELALRFGVSRSTVHRALQSLSFEGYVESHKRAGTMVIRASRPRKNLIGLVIDRVARNFDFPSMEMIEGIKEALGDSYGIVLCDSKDSIQREANFLSRMSRETDGIICFPIADQLDGTYLQQVRNMKVPVVVIDRIPEGFTGTSVVSDDQQATRQSLQYLRSIGHQNIGFLGFLKRSVTSAMLRHDTFVQTMETDLHTPCDQWVRWIGKEFETDGDVLQQAVYDAILSLLTGPKPITAIYCMQDDLALKVLSATEKLGKQVPDNFEIVTVNEWPALELRRPWDLHRIVRRKRQIGHTAATELLLQMDHPKEPAKTLLIPANFIPASPDNLPLLDGVQDWLNHKQSPKGIL